MKRTSLWDTRLNAAIVVKIIIENRNWMGDEEVEVEYESAMSVNGR